MFRRSTMAAAVLTSVLIAVSAAGAAVAAPTTPVKYNGSTSATVYAGLAFDQCTAPSAATMQAWLASPYRAVGVYIGGVNRTCAQPQLTASWVEQVSAQGWKLIPIYVGLQPSCGTRPDDEAIESSHATSQGAAAASDAVVQARTLGLLTGSPVYNDIENYSTTGTQCRTDVLNYLSGWTTRLHSLGFVSGVYANLSSGAVHLAADYNSSSHGRPDALWIARYDGNAALTGWDGITNSTWSSHGRGKQFQGNVVQTYGGVPINIDRNNWDAPVATVSYRHTLTGAAPVVGRARPSSSATAVGTYAVGSTTKIACQTPGTAVGGSKVWNKLTNGAYVPDAYVDTASATSYTAPISKCSYPYQISSSASVIARTGPGPSYASSGQLTTGSLAWVTCQRGGTKMGSSSVWDKLSDGRWVPDAYVGTPSRTTYSAPIPRCT